MHEFIMRDDMFIVTGNSLFSIPVFAATSQVPFGLPPALRRLHVLSFFCFIYICNCNCRNLHKALYYT